MPPPISVLNSVNDGARLLEVELDDLFEAAEQRWFTHWKRGPTRRVWSGVPPQVGDQAPDFELPDSTGALRSVGDFWRERPALLIFWRLRLRLRRGAGRASRR